MSRIPSFILASIFVFAMSVAQAACPQIPENNVWGKVGNDAIARYVEQHGGNDWAAAWAVRSDGAPLLPIGRGYSGERQRELANRFGVNLVMHVLTGNYKSDQVHVPALLDRLGQ